MEKQEPTCVWTEDRSQDVERAEAIHVDADGQPRPSMDISSIQVDFKPTYGDAALKLARDGHVSLIKPLLRILALLTLP